MRPDRPFSKDSDHRRTVTENARARANIVCFQRKLGRKSGASGELRFNFFLDSVSVIRQSFFGFRDTYVFQIVRVTFYDNPALFYLYEYDLDLTVI